MSDQHRASKCSRCGGSGMHSHGVCYGCNGLGIPATNDYLPFKKNVDVALDELSKAELIIQAMLTTMTVEQKALVAAQLEVAGISPDGMTRHHERRAALAAFGK